MKAQGGKIEANKMAIYLHKGKLPIEQGIEAFASLQVFHPRMNKSEQERYRRNKAKIDRLASLLKNVQDTPQQMVVALAVLYHEIVVREAARGQHRNH